jgi:flagellar biosynthesis protein FlhA
MSITSAKAVPLWKKILSPSLIVPVGLVGVVCLMLIPIPAFLFDILISLNILLAFLILLTTMYVKKPLDFSVFPTLLLVMTLFRISLNVASTRLVLGDGYAGAVIDAVGHFAINGNIIIGAVVFVILVVVQFIVIVKGSERVAEVGARFTLDSLPGKQMAIDADLNSGSITESQARERRSELQSSTDFYGAMDGASKFVKGDAIAGVIIILVNLLGGIGIGMLQKGLSIGDAVNTFTLLSIGDGLATQIPAMLMAVSTGMIVTRSGADSDVGSDAAKQLIQSPFALMIAGGASILLGLIPGMPLIIFFIFGSLLFAAGWILRNSAGDKAATESAGKDSPMSDEDLVANSLFTSRARPVEVCLSQSLLSLVDPNSSNDITNRIKLLRNKFIEEFGVSIPGVRASDDQSLSAAEYSIRIAGATAATGSLPAGRMLAIGGNLDNLPGDLITEPVFGLPGKWIPAEAKAQAERSGVTVMEREVVLVTHLSTVLKRSLPRLLDLQTLTEMNTVLKQTNPIAVENLIPGKMAIERVQQVLHILLQEQIPLNDLARIYETLAVASATTTEPEQLAEAVRLELAPVIVERLSRDNQVNIIEIDPILESQMLSSIVETSDTRQRRLGDPAVATRFLQGAQNVLQAAGQYSPIIVCSRASRRPVRALMNQAGLNFPVLSYEELSSNTLIEPISRGRISGELVNGASA